MTKPHRQAYGLGSFIKKAAKKVKKVAKKVWKSPLGKAALIGGGLYGLGGMQALGGKGIFASGQGLQRFRNLANIGSAFRSRGIDKLDPFHKQRPGGGIFSRAKKGLDKFGYGKAALLGLGTAGVLAPFIPTGEEDEEVIDDWSVTPSSIANIRNMARNQDPSLAFLPQSQYVQPGYYTGAQGGIVGLANGGAAGNAQAEQMLRMEYQKYRNQGGTMSYQQFKMAVLQQAQGQGPMAQGQQAPQGYANGELVEDASMIEETPTGMMA